MIIINTLIKIVVGILNRLLPALGVPNSFFVQVDGAVSGIISILQTASWFIPLDILVVCFGIMILADNFSILARIAQWIVRTVRG